MNDIPPSLSESLTKKERKELKRQQKEVQAVSEARARTWRRIFTIAVWVIVLIGVGGGLYAFSRRSSAPDESGVVSRSGLHWHSQLSLFIKGKRQEIPADIGIGIVHQPIHTHDTSGEIHMEFEGVVREDDLRLGALFRNWGKQFHSQCVLEHCNGTEGSVKMFVNGKENGEFERYIMRDKDKIEIRFE